MNRITARELAVGAVYALGFSEDIRELLIERTDPEFYEALNGEDKLYAEAPMGEYAEYIADILLGVGERTEELDGYIAQYAKGWQLKRLPKMAVAILRVCMYEILFREDIPNRAAINAAVDVSKRYEAPEITGFINGILGSFVRALHPGEDGLGEIGTDEMAANGSEWDEAAIGESLLDVCASDESATADDGEDINPPGEDADCIAPDGEDNP